MSQRLKRYAQRGVSSAKTEVHQAIKKVDKGLFPGAFCKIVPDHLTAARIIVWSCTLRCWTKSSLVYMYWRETGDLSVWKGIARMRDHEY